jgi:hypothetical protein
MEDILDSFIIHTVFPVPFMWLTLSTEWSDSGAIIYSYSSEESASNIPDIVSGALSG